MNMKEIMERGNKLEKQYSLKELTNSLGATVGRNDNEWRSCLQWALKQKANNTKRTQITDSTGAVLHLKS